MFINHREVEDLLLVRSHFRHFAKWKVDRPYYLRRPYYDCRTVPMIVKLQTLQRLVSSST